MVFSSVVFLFFFLPLTLALYFLSPGIRLKNILLLITSLCFYAWGEGELVALMILSGIFNYSVGIAIEKWNAKKLLIVIGVIINLLALVYYKYIGLLLGSFDHLFGTHLNNGIEIHLPIGISFYTFHSMSYIIDIYRKKIIAQKNPLRFLLYLSLFPQLVAGPIVRYIEIEKEIDNRKHTLERFVHGAKRFCIGLAKKVLLANVLGEIADELFMLPSAEMYYATSWFGLMAYTMQIYFDFSGYSDMGIGLGQMFGFTFPENFNFPYIAKSVKEFWRRWHMTLSGWFRDYLYIPLGGSRGGSGRTYLNLAIVFFLTGLWHGATWNFVLWGLFHGMFLIIERAGLDKIMEKTKVLGHLYTLLIVMLAWVLFRIPDLDTALNFYGSLIHGKMDGIGLYLSDYLDREYIVIFSLGILLSFPVKNAFVKLKNKIVQPGLLNAWDYASSVFHLLLLFLSAMSIASSTYNPFIYFRF